MHDTTQTSTPKTNTKHMALIGLMTAIICIAAPISITIPLSPVPISLGNLAIYFVLIVLGMKHGIISVVLYILLGLAGLPVFSGFSGGAGILFGPTGGYIMGYLPMALICGFCADRWHHHLFISVIGNLLGTITCYMCGTIWLAYQTELTLSSALVSGVLPFIPGDAVKMAIALTIGYQVRTRLKKAALI